jgi:hypothetical protein
MLPIARRVARISEEIALDRQVAAALLRIRRTVGFTTDIAVGQRPDESAPTRDTALLDHDVVAPGLDQNPVLRRVLRSTPRTIT